MRRKHVEPDRMGAFFDAGDRRGDRHHGARLRPPEGHGLAALAPLWPTAIGYWA